MEIATTPEVRRLIAAGAPVAIGVSGGKDSQAAALSVFELLDRCRHRGPRILVHSDLGIVEWRDSLPACQRLAAHLGAELVVLRRARGDLMDRWESRWQSSIARYQDLSTVTLVPCWSTPSLRFCTSEMKTHIIMADLRRRFGAGPILNVTGIRRAESRQRSRAAVADAERDGRIWTWRPILDWSEADVFACIDGHGLDPHPAYREFGLSRVSCRFCIMSSLPDLRAAAAQPETNDLYRRMVELEIESTFAFQGARWLGDIAPYLLSRHDRTRLAASKEKAVRRVAIERRITKQMLYVRGWPTRMLTDEEADVLAQVRREVSALLGLRSLCLDRASIHARYADLLSRKTGRASASNMERSDR